MPEIPKPTEDDSAEPRPLESEKNESQQETDVGDFVTRNVLEKDSVFFEG